MARAERNDTRHDDTRRWVGASAAHGNGADPDRWVLWGTGDHPDGALEPGNEIAMGIARGADPDWDEQGWVVVVDGAEDEIDEQVAARASIRGYAPYLSAGRTDEVPEEGMRGVLRNDVAPRRKVDQPRPT